MHLIRALENDQINTDKAVEHKVEDIPRKYREHISSVPENDILH